MNRKPIHTILEKLSEDGAPAEKVDLWQKIRTRLEPGNPSLQKGESHMNPRNKQPRLVRLGAVLAVIALAAVLLGVTPQGRAWAQEVLRFFNRAEGDTTATPESSTVDVWGLESLEEAEEKAGFDLLVPASVPPGYALEQIIFIPSTGEVTQLYKFSPYQSGELFVLVQSPTLSEVTIGSSASVENLEIGGTAVEYVSGQWFAEGDSITEQWIQDQPVHTFRWESGSTYVTLQFWVNETFSPAYLSRADMIALVEVVMGASPAYPETLNLNYLTTIEQAEEAAGDNVPAPQVLPEGFTFSYAAYEPGQRMTLIYEKQGGVRMIIFETNTPVDLSGYPAEALESVMIGEFQGTYIHDGFTDGVYDPNDTGSLYWEQDGTQISIQIRDGEGEPGLEKEDLIRMAESME